MWFIGGVVVGAVVMLAVLMAAENALR